MNDPLTHRLLALAASELSDLPGALEQFTCETTHGGCYWLELTMMLNPATSKPAHAHDQVFRQWIADFRETYIQPTGVPGGAGGTVKTWTDERKNEVRAYREIHGLKKTAQHYKVSQATISKHVPSEKAAKNRTGPWRGLVGKS